MKTNIGLQRIDDHRSHISGKRINRFLQKVDFQEFQDNKLKIWFEKYKNDRSRRT